MEYNSGIFKCIYCGNDEIKCFHKKNSKNTKKIEKDKINNFRNWISRKEFVNNNLETKYIFYESKNSSNFKCLLYKYTEAIFCACCELRCGSHFLESLCIILGYIIILLCIITYPVAVILYFTIGIWIECIILKYCFPKKYIGTIGNNNNIEADNDEELWKKAKNYTEKEIKSKYIFQCSKCKYIFNSFSQFIPGFNTNQEKKINVNDSERIMAINFSSTDQKIHFPVPCIKKDAFEKIEKKLYKEYPDYRNKNCQFFVNGRMIEVAKSIEDNKIKNGDNIIVFSNS